jgi:nucleoside-diphosphate-sugar epimerase
VAISADLANPGWTEFLPKDVQIDAVVHLAQSREFRKGLDGASSMVQLNVAATTELLSWAKTFGVVKFCVASTGNVYGLDQHLCSEDNFCAPEGMYALTKYVTELISHEYSKDMSVSILRLFGVYGPGQITGLIPTIFDRVRLGQEIELLSEDGLRINPIYVGDCVECIAQLLNLKSMPSLLNNAGGEIVSIRELATRIGVLLGIEPKFRQIDGGTASLVGDTARLAKYFPRPFSVNLDAGLKLVSASI